MKQFAPRSLLAEAQVLAWRFGWSWLLAAAVTVLAVALHLALLLPTRQALANARDELAAVTARRERKAPEPAPANDVQQVDALRAALRGPSDPMELVRRLGELARAEQITISQGEYQQQVHVETGLLQLHVTQPVRASYPQLKRYVENVLRTQPNASLDQIAARRDNVGQAQLDVRLRWTFWVQAPEASR
jgi:hypothetical protein